MSSEWVGDAPAGWRVGRLKTTVAHARNGIWGDEATGVDDVRCVRVADFDRPLQRISNRDVTYRSVAHDDRRGRLLQRGDLLLEKSGGGDKSPVGFVVRVDADEPAVCSNFVARVVLKSGMDPRFWTYVHGVLYRLRITERSIKQSTGIQNLDQASYFNERVLVPPPPEQRAIADFLDQETARIDAFTAKNEELITLLTERRAAEISQSVSRGLRDGVALKPSGTAWATEVPSHWRVGNIRRFASMKTGHTPSRQHPEYWVDCDIPWFTLADVWQLRQGQRDMGETSEKISALGLANSAAELLPAGTVALSRTASVGFAGIMPVDMATSQDFWNWVPTRELLSEYLWFQFQAMKPEFDRLMTGSTHRTIYQADAASFTIIVPPVSEQREIVERLDRVTRYIDEAIVIARRGIELARERRAALISAAVTGKIDVGVAA